MSAYSKNKGRTYEYKIRDLFTETFESQFERVPLSGALSYLKGDVYAPWLPDFPWCIEAKHHKEVPWNNILTAKSSLLIDFWKQADREAKVMNKNPLLVYRWDRSKNFCCWNDGIVKVDEYTEIHVQNLTFKMTLLDKWLLEAKKQYRKPN